MTKVLEANHNGKLREFGPASSRPGPSASPAQEIPPNARGERRRWSRCREHLAGSLVNSTAEAFGPLLRRIGRGGTVWWVN